MYSNLNHSCLASHERLHVVPDIVEEEDEEVDEDDHTTQSKSKLLTSSSMNDTGPSINGVQSSQVGVQSSLNNIQLSRNCAESSTDGHERSAYRQVDHIVLHIDRDGEHPTNEAQKNVSDNHRFSDTGVASHKLDRNSQSTSNTSTDHMSGHISSSCKTNGTNLNDLSLNVPEHVENEKLEEFQRQNSSDEMMEHKSLDVNASTCTQQTVPSSAMTLPHSDPTKEMDTSRKTSLASDASSSGSVDNDSTISSDPDFRMLKSAMKRSCEEAKESRKLSLFNKVMRRVSIHRRESTPTGRISTFLFGVDNHAEDMKQQGEGEEETNEKTELKDVEGHGGHKATTTEEKKAMQAAKLREGLFLMLSGLYGIIIVILGAVLPITEIFMGDVLDRTFQAFYIYLYVVSIVFLVYVYAYLLRRNQLKTEFLTRTLSRSLSWTRAWSKSMAKGEADTKGKRKRMISLDSNHHTGTFYLRLGVLGFGVGSMIHSGLNFGAYVSVSSSCTEPIQAIKPVIHLIFTFFQLYFIFMNSKMCIHRYKKLARFGLMHMCATNICVWFHSIVVETMHVIHMQHQAGHHGAADAHHSPGASGHHGDDHHSVGDHKDGHGDHIEHDNPVYSLVNTTVSLGRKLHAAPAMNLHGNDSLLDDSCQWTAMMGKAVEASGTYLYPCTIEYSLMCAGILYVMWKNVGTKPKIHRHSEHESDDEDDRRHRMSVDCTSSSRGLFLGILMTVGTIISIIAFYMLNHTDEMKHSGIILAHLSETAIYTVTLVALFLAAYRMKDLTFHPDHEVDLEDILVLISFTGLLAFIIFSLVASVLSKPTTKSGLTILSNLLMLFQSTTQTLFMLAGDRMTATTEAQARKKPGREFITFLLISNFAMWALNTFETQTPQHNPIQVEFYGADAWAIFTHISVPLGIYYRFHSTVCFSNIWKNAWKRKSH